MFALELVRSRVSGALPLLASLLWSGCSGPALHEPETFTWAVQPIAFSPPPDGWRREGHGDGGQRGIRFVKERSVGEAIAIGEYFPVGDRDRSEELRELLEDLDRLDDRSLRRALNRARWRTDHALSEAESAVASEVNDALEHGHGALSAGDRAAVRSAVAAALAAAERLQVTLDDVLDDVAFRPERRGEPDRYQVLDRRRILVAGRPAARVDYAVRTEERVLQAAEVYLMEGNHLFIASYIGTARHLALFDRVIASITFPARSKVTS